MKNNKQLKSSKEQRIERLKLSYKHCHRSLAKLINKKVKTPFDNNEISFFKKRIIQIRLSYYMESVPCNI